MASEHRIIKVNDLSPKRTRFRRYKRIHRGDVFRIYRNTSKSVNKIKDQFDFPSSVVFDKIDAGFISLRTKGTGNRSTGKYRLSTPEVPNL